MTWSKTCPMSFEFNVFPSLLVPTEWFCWFTPSKFLKCISWEMVAKSNYKHKVCLATSIFLEPFCDEVLQFIVWVSLLDSSYHIFFWFIKDLLYWISFQQKILSFLFASRESNRLDAPLTAAITGFMVEKHERCTLEVRIPNVDFSWGTGKQESAS